MACPISTGKNKPGSPAHNPLGNQNGSAILIAMMLLLMMTIIAISGSNTSVTESYIIRNVGLHKQNVSMVESAALELAQDALLNIGAPINQILAESAEPSFRKAYIVSDTDWSNTTHASGMSYHDAWYDPTVTGRVLEDADTPPPGFTNWPPYVVPGQAFFGDPRPAFGGPEKPSPSKALTDPKGILNIRGEAADTLRMAVVGWESAPLSSKKITHATRRRAWVRAEYVSPNYGMTRLEVGIERSFN